MTKPQILVPEYGIHNSDLSKVSARLLKGETYKDLSTVCIIPTRGMVHARVIQSWMNMMTPMNQKFQRFFAVNMEVGDAYNTTLEMILAHPELGKWKYLLCLEDDNAPPPDGLVKLYESIEGKVDGNKYDAVGGLYFTKGAGGQPMIYGDPKEMPKSFRPQIPIPDAVQPCNGLGMGFTLFRMSMFAKVPKPWFKTQQEYIPGQGTKMMTQDLYLFEKAGLCGFRFASDNRVKVGHFSIDEDIMW